MAGQNTRTPILKSKRTHGAVRLTLRDIIMKDMLTDSELKVHTDCNKDIDFDKLNIYIDYYEFGARVLFNLSINSDPASVHAEKFEMFLVSGNNNEQGKRPELIEGDVETTEPDTLVSFSMPIEAKTMDLIFSSHEDGYSYATYVIYAVLSCQEDTITGMDTRSRILMCKGKIYRTDMLFDMTESMIDGK